MTLSKISDELRRIEEDSIHSAKSHFESARIWSKWNLGLGIPSVIAASWAALEITQQNDALAFGLAFASAALTALNTFLNPSEKAQAHQNAGNQYKSLENQARIFREITLPTLGETPIPDEFIALAAKRDQLNEAHPAPLRRGFILGRLGIENGENTYKVDKNRGQI